MKKIQRWWRKPPTFLTVFLAVAAVYLLIQPPRFNTTDGAVRQFLAENIYYDGDLALTQAEEGDYLNNLYTIGRNDRPYLYFGIGQSLMQIPFYALLDGLEILGLRKHLSPYQHLPMSAVMLLSSALLCAFIFGIIKRLGYRRYTGLYVAMLAAFASILWGLSRQSFDMVQEAMAVTGALYFVLTAQKLDKRRWLHCVMAGIVLGVGVITRVSTLVAGPALALLVLGSTEWGSVQEKIKATAYCILGGLPFALWIPIYNYIRFEDFLSFGYTGHYPIPFSPLIPGMALWLVSPWQGLLLYMPLVLALFFVAKRFWRQHRLFFWTLIALFVMYLLFLGQYEGLGAFGWGPYYLLPGVIPFYVMFAEFFENGEALANWQRITTAGLIALTVLIQLPSLIVPTERYQTMLTLESNLPEMADLFWMPRYSPIRMQVEGALKALGNLPRTAEFIDAPPSLSAQDLMNHYAAYNLPDWWWFVRLMQGGQNALVVPVFSVTGLIWFGKQVWQGIKQNQHT